VTFEEFYANGDFQGVAQMNYCDEQTPFTRITEHKHFACWERHDQTVCFREYSKETGPSDIPYYPKRLEQDKHIFMKYRTDAEQLQNITFLGRLATYRYMDMHHVIGEALDYSSRFLNALNAGHPPPVFPNSET
jgi:UDP-galactopyranose mutase